MTRRLETRLGGDDISVQLCTIFLCFYGRLQKSPKMQTVESQCSRLTILEEREYPYFPLPTRRKAHLKQ